MLPDWRPGDPVGQSAMFTIDTCARAQNLPDDYLPYMQKFNPDPKFLFRAVSMGYGQRFAYTLARSYHDLLLKAGVPFDIEATASTPATETVPSKVRHRVMEEAKWRRWRKTSSSRYQLDDDFEPLTSARKANLKAAAMQVEWSLEPEAYVQQLLRSGSMQSTGGPTVSSTGGPTEAFSLEASGIEILDAAIRVAARERASQKAGVMMAVFDTGAQAIILAEEDVGSYIYDGQSTAQMAIVPAAKGSEFTPAQCGKLAMVFNSGEKWTTRSMPVLTASKAKLSKNLLGYEPFFQDEMQLDIRTKKATAAGYGTSRM